MAVSQQQKVDFLLKKLGFTKTKTGLAVDSTLTGTKKAGFAEAIPSPLIIANSSVWNEADSIPATPPGSDTNQVRVYLAASSGHRMTVDSTVADNRAFIAFSTYNDTSSTRLNNWIDTQFGAGYLIKVFKGDPNSGGVQLSAAGSGANDGWFFDYSAGVLNFNDTNVPSGVTGTNIYVVGYRYIGQTGAPTSGISTFSFLDLSVERNLDVGVQGGISTFRNNIDLNGDIDVSGILDVDGLTRLDDLNVSQHLRVQSGGGLQVGGITTSTVFRTAGGSITIDDGGVSETVGNAAMVMDEGTMIYTKEDHNGYMRRLIGKKDDVISIGSSGTGFVDSINLFPGNAGPVNLFHGTNSSDPKIFTQLGGVKVNGTTRTDNLVVLGVSTTLSIDVNGDLDVDGHTNLDNVSISGVTTTSGLLDINAGGQANTFKVEDLTDNRIVIAGTGGELEDSGNLTFNGTTLGVTGDATFSGNVSIGGTLTYEDVANVDSVGLLTARSGIRVTGGVIEAQAGENKIPFLYANTSSLPDPSNYHGMFAHVHATQKGYFAHAGNWYELVNRELTGTVGTGTETYNIKHLNSVGISTFTSTIDANGDLDVDGHTNLDNVSVAGVSTFTGNIQMAGTGNILIPDRTTSGVNEIRLGSSADYRIYHNGTNAVMDNLTGSLFIKSVDDITFQSRTNNEIMAKFKVDDACELYFDGGTYSTPKLATTAAGVTVDGVLTAAGLDISGDIDVDGHTNLDNVSVAGVSTFASGTVFTGAIDANGDLDVDGHTNLDNVSIAGVTTITQDLDVDGHTNLDNVSIAGFTTITQDLDVDGHTNLDNVSVSGVSTFTGDATFNGNITFGDATIDNVVFTGDVNSNIIPNTDNTYTLGTSSKRWAAIHVGLSTIGEDITTRNLDVSGIGTIGSGSSGQAILQYQGATKLETQSWGTRTTGTVQSLNGNLQQYYASATNTGSLLLTNNTGNALKIGHISSNSFITGVVGNISINAPTVSISTNFTVGGVTTLSGNTVQGGQLQLNSTLKAGGIVGSNGYYLKSTGIGVTWSAFPTARTTQSFTASSGQTTFSFAYNVNYLDVFVNGTKLTPSEFTATNGTSVVLAVGCFVGDIVDLISYNVIASGGATGIDNIVEDVTPQLGGNLDLFSKTITGTGNINMTGVATATKFVGDGSGLTGIVASGSGVVVKDNGSAVGTAGTINFGTNLDVSNISAGIVTVTAAGISTANIISDTITSGTLNVTGVSTFSEGLFIPDTKKIEFGNAAGNADLEIVHDSNNSVIRDKGTGSLALAASTINFLRYGTADYYARFISGGRVDLRYNGDTKFETTASGIDVTGTAVNDGMVCAGVSTFSGLINANANIKRATGNLDINASNIVLKNAADSATYASFNNGGNVELHFNNVKRFETTNTGAVVAGIMTATSFSGDGSALTGISGVGTDNVRTNTLEVVGVSTFTGNIDANGDLDVDGHTNLDNLIVAGVSTFASDVNVAENIIHTGDTDTKINFPSAGNIITLHTNGEERVRIGQNGSVGIGTWNPEARVDIYDDNTSIAGLLQLSQQGTGDASINFQIKGAQEWTIGADNSDSDKFKISSTAALGFNDGDAVTITTAGNVSIVKDFDVDGHTNLDNVSVAGVCTAANFVGDGSGLTGVVGSGSGVIVQHDGSNIGTAGTINFSTNLDVSAISAGIVTVTASGGGGADVGITTNLSGTFTASAGTPSTINTFTGYSSDDLVVEYTIYIKNGSDFQTQKLLAMRDGTTIHSTQFAVMFSSSLLVQCDATISSGNILLRATPETGVSGSTTYKVKREVM